eukprot:jgi/Picsp_1/2160/NSC_05625-R1_---NA---
MSEARTMQPRTEFSGFQAKRVILRFFFILAIASHQVLVKAQEDLETSNGSQGLDITPVPPLPPAPTYVPELSPQVDFVVTAGLPGGVACTDLTLEQLDDLAIGYCMNIGKLGKLSASWYPTVCQATCPTSRRSMLQVNPVIFNVDCVRTTEDPEDVPLANQEALDLEQAALNDGLLTDVLEATLPGSELLTEKVTSTFIEGPGGAPGSSAEELDITPVPPLPPAPTYVPELSPQVDFVVTAGLPGGVACTDLTLEQLDDLAIGYCMNIGKLGKLSASWYPTVCQATCPTSRRSMLQVNPVIFNVDCVRTTEDPEDVPLANQEALDLEQAALNDGLLTDVLEATLPGSELLTEKVTSTFIEGPGSAGTTGVATPDLSSGEEKEICRDISPSEDYNCRQQKRRMDDSWELLPEYLWEMWK